MTTYPLEALSYSHQKEYVDWVEGGFAPSTRQSRMLKMIQMLALGDLPKRKKASQAMAGGSGQ